MLGAKLHPWRVYSLCALQSCPRTRLNDTLHRWPVFRQCVPLLHRWPVFSLSTPETCPRTQYGCYHAWHRWPVPMLCVKLLPRRVLSLCAPKTCPWIQHGCCDTLLRLVVSTLRVTLHRGPVSSFLTWMRRIRTPFCRFHAPLRQQMLSRSCHWGPLRKLLPTGVGSAR